MTSHGAGISNKNGAIRGKLTTLFNRFLLKQHEVLVAPSLCFSNHQTVLTIYREFPISSLNC